MSDKSSTPQWMIEQGCSPKSAQWFFKKVNANGPIPEHLPELGQCHVWLAAITGRGYGQFRPTVAHRFAWMLVHGPIPQDMLVLHKCDNPVCVNPDHLFIGTDADNARDKMLKDRSGKGRKRPGTGLRGECNTSSKLTWTEIRTIRHLRTFKSQRALAEHFKVDRKAIWKILHFKSWIE